MGKPLVAEEHKGEFMDALYDVVVKQDRDTGKIDKLKGVFQAFWTGPEKEARAVLQNYTTKLDLPDVITNAIQMFQRTDNFDLGFELAFQLVTTDPGRLEWEIVDVRDEFSFELMAEGEEPRILRMSADVVRPTCHRYSAAIGWTYDMIIGRRLSAMLQMSERARVAYNLGRANRFYSLLKTAGASNVTTWQTPSAPASTDAQYTTIGDVRTLNKAAYDIAYATKDSGYGDTANASFILYYEPQYRDRIAKIFNAQNVLGSLAADRVQWNITPVATFNSNLPQPSTGVSFKALLVMPNRKIQRAMPIPMMERMKESELSLDTIQAFHYYEGACVADILQVRQIEFA